MKQKQPPDILGTKILAESRVFRIEQVDLRFSNGETRQFERLLNRNNAVMVAPMLDNDTILLIREYAVGYENYELGLPKGVIETNEDILVAGNREMQEEVGYAANKLHHLRQIATAPGYLSSRMEIVVATDLYPSQLPGDEPEPLEVVPWRLSQIDQLFARDDCNEARTIAALYMVRDYLDKLN